MGIFPHLETHMISECRSLVTLGKIATMKKYALTFVKEKPKSSLRGPFDNAGSEGFTHGRCGRALFAPKALVLFLFLVVVV